MWTFPILFLLFALGCLACAITGGGLTALGTSIPKLSNLQRAFSGVAGLGFLALALYLQQASTSEQESTSEPPPPPLLEPVVIGDRLGNRQTYERLSIEIDGARAGEIVLTSTRRTGQISLPATNRMVSYVLEGEEVSRSRDGDSVQLQLTGDGTIRLLAGGQYCVQSTRRRAADAPNVGRRILSPGDQCLP